MNPVYLVRWRDGERERIGVVRDATTWQAVPADQAAGRPLASLDDLSSWAADEGLKVADGVRRLAEFDGPQVAVDPDQLLGFDLDQVWESGRSQWELGLTGNAAEASPPGELILKQLGSGAKPGEPLGLRRDASWQVVMPGITAVVHAGEEIIGYGLGLDVTALDHWLAGRPQAAKLFYHSFALGPRIAVYADEPEQAEWPLTLTVERGGERVLARTVGKRADASGLLSAMTAWYRNWPPTKWSGVITLAAADWDETFFLQDGDRVSLAAPSLGVVEHEVRRIDPAWAPVKPGEGNTFVQVHPEDNVAVALRALLIGDRLTALAGTVTVLTPVPFGHKVAVRPIAQGQAVVKYGEIIGQASQDIGIGEHVHVHNCDSNRGRGDLAGTEQASTSEPIRPAVKS